MRILEVYSQERSRVQIWKSSGHSGNTVRSVKPVDGETWWRIRRDVLDRSDVLHVGAEFSIAGHPHVVAVYTAR